VNKTFLVLIGGVTALLLQGCEIPEKTTEHAAAPAASTPAHVTNERLLKAELEPSQWMTYNGTYSEQRFSRLTGIKRDNVKQLGLEWFADYDTNLTQAGTPLQIDGVLYVSTAWSKVYAFDARTGKQLWQYDPKTPGEWIRNVCCGIVNRGIAAYNGKIYIGTLDGRLVAIDAKTGKEAWSTLTIDKTKHYSITSAPRIAKGMVFIGNSGGEYGIRGYIAAYDAETGKQVWRVYTVPGNPNEPQENAALTKAAATWPKNNDWWGIGGGGSVWDAIVYDPNTDYLYFGTGNGSPWNQAYRDPSGGDNLYLASIVAVKASTGEYVWHYQTTPADTWDYDAVSPMMTADITIDGKKTHVLMQACKNGFMYVLDATNGKLLRANAFTEVNWADGVDLKTGRPRTKAEARYPVGKPFNLAPGVQGAHGWHSNAFNPDTGLIYIATQEAYYAMIADPNYKRTATGYNLGLGFGATIPGAKSGFIGYLQAWDPVAAKAVWKSDANNGPTGGAVATASGLIFQGNGSGQLPGTGAPGAGMPEPPGAHPPAKPELRAFDAKTGEKLWSFGTQTGILAAPITYELDGQQYVAVSVGGAVPGGDYYAPNYSRLLVFGLNGKATLPATTPYTPRPLDPPASTASADVVKAGEETYGKYCSQCHGDAGQARGAMFPNLTRTPMLHSQEGFDTIVLNGVLAQRGMASFSDSLKPADTQEIRAYLIKRANDLKNAPPLAPPPDNSGNQHQQPGK
jgi:quinohemoprotein ethanol dehydrogenase